VTVERLQSLVSIVIPGKNAERSIDRVLRMIFQQSWSHFEVVFIDSGSIDRTLEIIKNYPVRVQQIRPEDFNHGCTRNMGVDIAKGDILVYLNSDAIPYNKEWLENLVRPLEQPRVAASYSRQIPHSGLNPADEYFIYRTYPETPKIFEANHLGGKSPDNFVLFSTVSAAIRGDVAKRLRFRDNINLCEDQELACRILRSGYRIAYQPESIVIHSHKRTLLDLFHRYYETGYSTRSIPEFRSYRVSESVRYLRDLTRETTCYVHRRVNHKQTYWCLYSILHILVKSLGFYIGRMRGLKNPVHN